MAKKTPTLKSKVAKLALDHPEHRTALVQFMREAGWIPEEFKDDTFVPGQVTPDEPTDGQGSQVPPARDNNGHPTGVDYEPTDAEFGIVAVRKAQDNLLSAHENLGKSIFVRLVQAGFRPTTTLQIVDEGISAQGKLFDKSGSLRNSDEVRQVLASVYGTDKVDLVGFAPRWEYEVG